MAIERLSRVALAMFVVSPVAGCDDGAGTGGASTTSSSTVSASSGTTSSTSATSSGSSSTGGGCALPAGCAAPAKDCVGSVDNAGQTKFGLRVTWLDLVAPQSLDTPVLKNVIEGGALPLDMSCNLFGSGNFVWLMEFDTAASTMKTGGAKPGGPASAGFAFVDEMVPAVTGMIHVQPTTLPGLKPDAQGAFSSTADADVVLPIYTGQTATSAVLLPLHRMRFTMGTLSADQNCVGHYNAAGLDPENLCVQDDTHPAFLQGGAVDAVIVLEEADNIVVDVLNESLCVLLSGDPNQFGEPNAQGLTVCKRTGGVIDFKGDTCSSASGGCDDAVKFSATYAASSIQIN